MGNACTVTDRSPLDICIPPELVPSDGRFGCGPSKIRPEAVAGLAASGASFLGTSHRQAPVRDMVGRLRSSVTDLFGLPADWEVVLGVGGSTAFWDVASFCLVESRSQHLSFGEFSSKFATACTVAPHLDGADVLTFEPGTRGNFNPQPGVDVYAHAHNETSTGVAQTPERPAGADNDALVVIDATSAAGGLTWNPAQVDVYYFAPQKCFASDGGLWVAAMSPAAQERARRLVGGGRWVPEFLNLVTAMDNSAKNQTYNTPGLAGLWLMVDQLEWMLDQGGMDFCTARTAASAGHLYGWAERSGYATPFVADPAARSNVVGTIDLDHKVPAAEISRVLRANGIVDTDAYRKLGRNQLRIAMFPAVEPDDVALLTACIDYVVGHLA